MSSIVKNDLFDYRNRYIYQQTSGFKFSIDSLLLAEYVKLNSKTKNILDMCTGNAPVPLVLSLKTKANIVGVEYQDEISNLAEMSVSLNNLDEQIRIINDDVKNIGNYYKSGYFDIITCNPPYFKVDDNSFLNEIESLMYARHEVLINLQEIMELAAKYLKDNGVFYLVHRATRLDEIIYYAKLNNINVKELVLVKTKEEGEVNTVLAKCVKRSNDGLKIKKIICVDNLDSYQHLFEDVKL